MIEAIRQTFSLNLARGMSLLPLSEQLQYSCEEETRLWWVKTRLGEGWRHPWMSATFSRYWTAKTSKEGTLSQRGRKDWRNERHVYWWSHKGERGWDQMCKWSGWLPLVKGQGGRWGWFRQRCNYRVTNSAFSNMVLSSSSYWAQTSLKWREVLFTSLTAPL